MDVQLTHTAKASPLAGPQGYGKAPTLTEVRVAAYDQYPDAQCKSSSISATDDSTANGGIGGRYANTQAGFCTAGAPLTIDNASFDPDTEESDTPIVNLTTIVRISYQILLHARAAPPCMHWPMHCMEFEEAAHLL